MRTTRITDCLALGHICSKNKKNMLSIDNGAVNELANDGTLLVKVIQDMSPFQSITGEPTRIDSEGNSEGSFTAYAFMEKIYTYTNLVNDTRTKQCIQKNFTCSHFLDKVTL